MNTALESKANSSDLNNYLPLNGGTLTGNVYGRPVVGSMSTATGDDTTVLFASKENTLNKGDTVTVNRYFNIGAAVDATGLLSVDHKWGHVQTSLLANGKVTTDLGVYTNVAGATTQANLGIGFDESNNVYTFAPTPETSDNSTKIATTAFVNSRLPYTNGTFTPVFKGDSTAGAFTYTIQYGKYWKLGRLVYIYIILEGKCTSQPIGSYCGITGLPFNAAYIPNCGVSTSDYCGGGTADCFHRICWGYIAQSNNFGGPVVLPKVIHSTNNTFDYAKITASDTSGYNLSIAVNESFHMRFTGIYLASS